MKAKRRKRVIDMTEGPLFSGFLFFALPIMAMSILQMLFNTTNMVIVGRFIGDHALASVGASGALINLIVGFFLSLSVGASVVIAQEYGAGRKENVGAAVHTSITISIVAGLFVMALGLVLCRPILILMGTPDDILDMAVSYTRIYFFSIPASMVYNFAAAIMRATGDSRRPMNYLLIAGVINVILNLFFVIVLGIGVAGVAWATVFSQFVALALILLNLCRTHQAIRIIPKHLRIHREPLVKIIRIGLPAGIQSLLFSISNVLIQSGVNSFGSTMVAANAAAGNVESFVATTMTAYHTAAIAFTGQNMGAKKYKRIDSIAKVCTVLIFASWLLLGGATVLFARPLLSIFTSDPRVIDLGTMRITIMMAAYFTCGVMNVFPGLTRGMGFSVLPMLCTLIGACLLRIVWLNTVFAWHHTEFVLFVCYPITWGIAGLGQVASFFYARGKIKKQAVLG